MVVEQTANPHFEREGQAHQTELQQAVARKKRGSRGWKLACRELRRFKARQARQRLDFHHKLSARIAREAAVVAHEKLNIKNMTASAQGTLAAPGRRVQQKAGLNRQILDTAPSRLQTFIRYKVLETGGWVEEAPTKQLKPSQTCPACGRVAKKALAERVHRCSVCGHVEDRDVAAARVVLKWLEEKLSGQELPRQAPARLHETPSISP